MHPGPKAMASMDGKVALVTGATGGIGGAIATALAREGATIAVVGRSGKLWSGRREMKTPGMGSDPEARKRFWNECDRLSKTA